MNKLGKYELIERLAVGGMAELFKAQMLGDRGFKKTVAIKKILPQLAANSNFLDMFADEARLTAMLDHPNIVQVFEFDTEDDEPYLVMQLVDGHDLFLLMGQLRKLEAPLPIELGVFIVHELLDALDYAHNAEDDEGNPLGIVHRDVSPGNVLISKRGNVMLTDFGIAWAYRRHQKTEAGKLKGKFGYMSPEQVTGDVLDARSDVFACGILLAELLINRHLFVGQSDLDILLMVRDADLGRLIQYGEHIPKSLMDIIVKALAAKPGRRHQSARAFRDALGEWLFNERKRVTCNELADYVRWVRQRIIDQAVELANQVSPPGNQPMRDAAKGSDASAQRELGDRHSRAASSPDMSPRRARPHSADPVTRAHRRQSSPGSSPRGRVALGSQPGERGVSNSDLDVFTRSTRKQQALADGGMGEAHQTSRPGTRPISVVSDPDDYGDFTMVTPMSVFYRLAASTASGLLILKRGAATKEAYFHAGHPRFVSSNIPDERLGEFLVRRGAIEQEELDEALVMLPHYDKNLLEALISLGFLDPLDAFRYLNAQVTAKLMDVCYWTDGTYAWYDGRRAPRKSRKLQLDMYSILGNATRAIDVPEIVAWAKRIRNLNVCQNLGGSDLDRFGMGEAMVRAQVLLENHEASVTDLAGRVRDPAARLEFIRALYLLIQCGLATLEEPR